MDLTEEGQDNRVQSLPFVTLTTAQDLQVAGVTRMKRNM
jgi:hypothetical protein